MLLFQIDSHHKFTLEGTPIALPKSYDKYETAGNGKYKYNKN